MKNKNKNKENYIRNNIRSTYLITNKERVNYQMKVVKPTTSEI